MATAFCTLLCFGAFGFCMVVRLMSPSTGRLLFWTVASMGFFGFAWWGLWEMVF